MARATGKKEKNTMKGKASVKKDPMSKGYRKLWNDKLQARIDEDIEKHRKADANWKIPGLKTGMKVCVEQTKHDFVFGAQIFNFDQLGTDERNEKYKALYGTLFNSATIAFYWKTLEPEEGKLRFEPEFRDSAEFWNTVKEPKLEPHWRRPATDPVVNFCEKKGVRLHGHPLVWGNFKWQYPGWLLRKISSSWKERLPVEKAIYDTDSWIAPFEEFTAEQMEKMMPGFSTELLYAITRRIVQIAERYGKRIHSWDVCNESATDFERGLMKEDSILCKSVFAPMPGDYTYRAFKLAEAFLPRTAKLNINDYELTQGYVDQVADLRKRDCKIDILGAQMHLFDPQYCLDIADGKSNARQTPAEVTETMKRLSRTGLPIHLSEITITAPNNDARGQAIQAEIARNLYRLWFSTEKMMGITWWNVVDDCGAPGEPSVSGLFSRDMTPKPAFFALDNLINNEWKTRLTLSAGQGGSVKFRGFRGTYRVSWTDESGELHMKFLELK